MGTSAEYKKSKKTPTLGNKQNGAYFKKSGANPIRLHHHRIYVEIFCLIGLITIFNFSMDGHGLFGQFTRFLRFNRVPLSHDDIPPSIF